MGENDPNLKLFNISSSVFIYGQVGLSADTLKNAANPSDKNSYFYFPYSN